MSSDYGDPGYPSDEEELDDPFSDNQTSSSPSDDDDDDDNDSRPPQPVSQNFFAPPFYGRPPTPLPPSPSLTSLLRPSRPTTPDASDDELEPVPRASPKVPTYEYYGFVLYIFSSLTFLVYLLWAYLPSPFLHALGVYYYPNRWWALAIPAFLVMLIIYIYVALAAYNIEYLTLPMASLETIVDEASKIATIDSKGRIRPGEPRRQLSEARARELELNFVDIWSEGTDAVMDIPLAGVNEVLYGSRSEETGGEAP